MATQLQLRRGTTSETGSFTGAVGEVTVDTTKDTLVVHDGATAGGHEMAKKDGSNMTAIDVGDNVQLKLGTGDDLLVFHNGSNSYIQEQGTGDLYIGASNNLALMNAGFSENKLLATTDGAVTLYHNGSPKIATTSSGVDVTGTATMDGLTVDNITIDGNEIDVSSGNLTLDVAGGIVLDGGSNDLTLNNSGTTFAYLSNNSGSLQIYTPQQDKDIIFKGSDGGSAITALTLDMSEAGAATFNSNVSITNGDLTIASGKGVFLGGTAAANKLDDYEEGTWTPTLTTGTATAGTSKYTKVGRLVTCYTQLSGFSDTTSNNEVIINGLPFSAEAIDRATTMGSLAQHIDSSFGSITGGYLNGAATMLLYTTSTSGFIKLKHSHLNSSSSTYLSFSYMAS